METEIRQMRSLRLKVTDRCPWNCWFCHNEGTGARNPLVIKDLPWSRQIQGALQALKDELMLDEIHLTGGEPTAHAHIEELVTGLAGSGFSLKMTTIGSSPDKVPGLIRAGVRGFNFSVHSLDPGTVIETQLDRSLSVMEKLLEHQKRSVALATEHGAEVKANIVIVGDSDHERVLNVLDWAKSAGVSLRLLRELSLGAKSEASVYRFLDRVGAVQTKTVQTIGVSASSDEFTMEDGYVIAYKRIVDAYLPEICDDCTLRDTVCTERFYTIRGEYRVSEDGPDFLVRLCLQRQDPGVVMPIDEFLNSDLLPAVKRQLAIA